jgi:hypothetical protein
MTTPVHGFLDQPAQRADIRQGEVAGTLLSLYRRGRPTDDTPPSPILRRVAHQQPVAHRLVQHKHHGRDRVLDRRTTVRRFPLVDRPIDQPRRHHRHREVPERRQHAFAQSRRVRVQRRRGIDPASPPISQLSDIVGEWLTGVDTRSGGTLQALDPGPRLFERSVLRFTPSR